LSLDFLIVYESKNREFESICLLKNELEWRGYTVEFRQLSELVKIKHYLHKRPKVLILPSVYTPQHLKNLLFLCGRVKKIATLQWEQLGSDEFLPKNLNELFFISWNESNKSKLESKGSKKAVIIGCISLDFLRPEFIDLYKTKVEIFKQYQFDKKKIVLFISSFSGTSKFMSDSDLENYKKLYGMNFFESRDEADISQKKILVWIDRFLAENTNVIFVYRPHPSEMYNNVKYSIFYKLIKKYNNFKIISDYSVNQWILVSDTIFTWSSISIIGAFFSNKMIGILRPIKLEHYKSNLYSGGRFITSYEEMCREFVAPSKKFPLNEIIIRKQYKFYEKPHYIKLCDFLEEVICKNEYSMNNYVRTRFNCLTDCLRLILYSIKFKILVFQKKILKCSLSKKSEKKIETYFKAKKHNFYNKKELQSITSKLDAILYNNFRKKKQ
jgi:surface carbohydrate biosynthesis protein